MASGTLERATEVVEVKGEPVSAVAAKESRAKVEGAARTGEARAWNARAQID